MELEITFIRLNKDGIYACSKQMCLERGNDMATFFPLFIE